MKKEEARIAAHICGDGWLYTWNEKNSLQIVHGRRYYRPRQRYEIGYSNTSRILLDKFSDDMKNMFGVIPQMRNGEVRVRSKRIYDRIRSLGGGSTYTWYIGKEIMSSSTNIKKAWLQAFFDDEATVDKVQSRIRVKCMNKEGLIAVKQLLLELKIESQFTGPNCDKSWYITINRKNIRKFFQKINFIHAKKKMRLENIIDSLGDN